MDSSENIIHTINSSEQPELVGLCDNEQLKNPLNESSEESILLGKIPANIFQQLKS